MEIRQGLYGAAMMQFTIEDYVKTARYEGPVNADDCARLEGQTLRIYRLMIDGIWRTLEEIQRATGDPQASISAQLRHLRKGRFGSNIVDKQRRGNQWEYRLQRRAT